MISKPLGNILSSTSIDDAAAAAVRAARMWGDEAAITMTDSGECTAWMAHTPTIDRYVAEHPGELVGVYDVTLNSAESRKRVAEHIAEDIWEHVRLKSSARVAA